MAGSDTEPPPFLEILPCPPHCPSNCPPHCCDAEILPCPPNCCDADRIEKDGIGTAEQTDMACITTISPFIRQGDVWLLKG